MKHENKCKRKGKSVLQALEEKNLAKRMEENDKKILIRALTDRIERERVWKLFEKMFEHVRIKCFKKVYTIFDWSKNRFDRSKMLRLIQYQSSIDRNNRGWLKILIAISIDRKTGSIDRNFGKNFFLKNKAILCRNSSKHWILWIKCMSMRWNVFHKHKFWTQFSQN